MPPSRRGRAGISGAARAAVILAVALWARLAAASGLELADELFAESDWTGCARECRRALAVDPSDEAARQLLAASRERLNTARGQPDGVGPRRRLLVKPAEWFVAFYRAQVRPALGQRCPLIPSCSEYFLQAVGGHGWLGLPLIADRFVREASVANGAPPVIAGGRLRFRDPLADHDGWLRRRRPDPSQQGSRDP